MCINFALKCKRDIWVWWIEIESIFAEQRTFFIYKPEKVVCVNSSIWKGNGWIRKIYRKRFQFKYQIYFRIESNKKYMQCIVFFRHFSNGNLFIFVKYLKYVLIDFKNTNIILPCEYGTFELRIFTIGLHFLKRKILYQCSVIGFEWYITMMSWYIDHDNISWYLLIINIIKNMNIKKKYVRYNYMISNDW